MEESYGYIKMYTKSAVDNDDFVYRYQLSNQKQILSEWLELSGDDIKDSWQNIIPSA